MVVSSALDKVCVVTVVAVTGAVMAVPKIETAALPLRTSVFIFASLGMLLTVTCTQ